MKTILKEALNIDGLQFLGEDAHYEVYKAITWDGIQQLVDHHDNPAGEAFAQDAATFNAHLGEGRNMQIYLFVEPNTNRVSAGILTGRSTDKNLQLTEEITLPSCNLQFESGINHDAYYFQLPHILPLYLIPTVNFDNLTITEEGCLIDDNNKLLGIFPEFIPNRSQVESITLPENVTSLLQKSINQEFINRDQGAVTGIYIPQTVTSFARGCIVGNDNLTIYFEAGQLPFNNDCGFIGNPNVELDAFLSDEEKAERDEQRRLAAERAEQERLRQEEEARLAAERAEQERIERQRQANAQRLEQGLYNDGPITYKLYDTYAEVVFCKKRSAENRDTLEIRAEVEGKPVTKIGKYSFAQANVAYKIKIPTSVKQIDQGAFANCNSQLLLRNDDNYLKSLKLGKQALAVSRIYSSTTYKNATNAYDFIYDFRYPVLDADTPTYRMKNLTRAIELY